MRIIVTRPQPEAGKWVQSWAQAGFDAVALPLIDIGPAPQPQTVVAAWERLHSFDAVMFVSANAIAQFFALKPALTRVFIAQAAIKTRAFVVGPASVTALLERQAEAAFIDAPGPEAPQFDSEALWAVVGHRVVPGYRVLVVRGAEGAAGTDPQGQGRNWLAEQIQSHGGTVEFVVAYQRRCPVLSPQARALVQQAAVDGSVWVFSSSEAIANLRASCPEQSWAQARAVVTHGRIAQAARQAGFAVVCESRPPLASLVASIESLQ